MPTMTGARARTHRSGRVALGGARPRLRRLDLAVLRRRVRLQLVEQLHRHRGDVVDRTLERLGVGARGLVEAADLADVLERRGADLFLGRLRLEVVERSDVPAHTRSVAPTAPY